MGREHKPTPICPKCGLKARRTETKYGERHSCCDLWSWDRKPLVDKATHDARQAAHAAFDPMWKTKEFKRKEAYRLLSKELGLHPEDTHMSLMPAEIAARVPEAVERIRTKAEA